MVKKTPKTRAPQDLTLRNNNARKKEIIQVAEAVAKLEQLVAQLEARVENLEAGDEDLPDEM